jgi:hypothetical protein
MPPRTTDASSAPGSNARADTRRRKRNSGTQSQNVIEPTTHAANSHSQPCAWSVDADAIPRPTTAVKTKKKIA